MLGFDEWQWDKVEKSISFPSCGENATATLWERGFCGTRPPVPLPQLSLAIVGVDYPNKRGPTRRFELAICRPGEPVELRPEPKNPADPNAIAVYSCRGIQLGYLTAERAPRIGQIIRRGHEVTAVFQDYFQNSAALRLAFDGEQPILPKPQELAEPEPDWWPDEVWDECCRINPN